jgi:hypothetical protein
MSSCQAYNQFIIYKLQFTDLKKDLSEYESRNILIK